MPQWSRSDRCIALRDHAKHLFLLVVAVCVPAGWGQRAAGPAPSALYQRPDAPIEQRVQDLMGRMILEGKARQLDLNAGATALVGKYTDKTHTAPDSRFLPEKAEALRGNLGVRDIHELNPTPEQANAIQRWVILTP